MRPRNRPFRAVFAGFRPAQQFCYCFGMGDVVRIPVCCFEIDDSDYNILVTLMMEPTSNIQGSHEIVSGGQEHGRLPIFEVEMIQEMCLYSIMHPLTKR